MKFDSIDQSIRFDKATIAKNRYRVLALELGVRDTNYHVGTGLGGNNLQLFTLMNVHNELVNDRDLAIEVTKDKILWGVQWLGKTKMADIRHELNAKFPLIQEKHKYPAIALKVLTDHPETLRKGFLDNKKHFPKLAEALAGKPFSFDPNLSNWEMLVAGCILCQELASDLDQDNHKRISFVALALMKLPMEINLIAIRRYIQIERLVKHNLDEHSDFSKILTIINIAVNHKG
jgi:hypothetical protein